MMSDSPEYIRWLFRFTVGAFIIFFAIAIGIIHVFAYPQITVKGDINRTEIIDTVNTVPKEYIQSIGYLYVVEDIKSLPFIEDGFDFDTFVYYRSCVRPTVVITYDEILFIDKLYHEIGHVVCKCYTGNDSEESAEAFKKELMLRNNMIQKNIDTTSQGSPITPYTLKVFSAALYIQ